MRWALNLCLKISRAKGIPYCPKSLGDSEGQGSLECCSPWSCKELAEQQNCQYGAHVNHNGQLPCPAHVASPTAPYLASGCIVYAGELTGLGWALLHRLEMVWHKRLSAKAMAIGKTSRQASLRMQGGRPETTYHHVVRDWNL